ncbi:hypothetical protein OB236_08210 [Paenibacillus sp. WQ 127069]|uniref:Uncharacterized protein n=1 Tax=Paenibacillus baimaensis TaxID=2982185 RepID=A0ABT2UBV4_9BACL|nr:hypothetical protein [Paenibacillus sp. WQ 127069]MCU6792108.1 hypothetical protein [Paenibacillus sp. WQ 127069]
MEIDRTEEILKFYGLEPDQKHIESIRSLLIYEVNNRNSDDNEYMKTLCILLFILGHVEDTLLIWSAKRKNFDAGNYIDVQLLCGAGLEETKRHLKSANTLHAIDQLKYLEKSERSNDFVNFTRENVIKFYKRYYAINQ